MLSKRIIYLFVLFTALAVSALMNARELASGSREKMGIIDVSSDTSKVMNDSLSKVKADSLLRLYSDTSLVNDTLTTDTARYQKKQESDFKSKVVYTAKDSVAYSADHAKFYLYGDVKITYEDIELDAAYVEYDLPQNMVYASGVQDTTGQTIGKPKFKKGNEEFKSETLYYNFKSKKGIIYKINTEQEGGFLHAEKTKRQADGSIHIKNGQYTTCNADHPHFYLALTKGVVIPEDKIVSGPAYLVMEDVPLPLAIPFGFFPNKRQATSGIIMPRFGQSSERGFSLENGGYYLALSQYYDLAVTGDIFSKGTWGVNLASRYTRRYKFGGNLTGRYYLTQSGVKGVTTGNDAEAQKKDISIQWTHSQDPKSNPTSRFSANVNYSTSTFDRNQNYTDPRAMVTSTKSSSISYNKSWTNFNLSVNLRHNQNSTNKLVTFGLPSVNFTANRIYPFKRKNPTGPKKWYENISTNYTATLENNMSAHEDSIFRNSTLKNAQNGFRHSIPLSTNFKILKYFNLSPSLNYTGWLYTTRLKLEERDSFDVAKNKQVYYLVDNVTREVSYAHSFSPSASISFNPSLYGMLQFGKNSSVRAIRHVMTPSVSFSYVPGIRNFLPDYYDTVKRGDSIVKEYSIYSNRENVFGAPPRGSEERGSFSFSIGNNLEMKVKSDKDTATGTRKIVLIQSFNISTSYNPFLKRKNNEFPLSSISMNGSTPLTKNLNINYNGTIDPYILNDSTGVRENKYSWEANKGIGRLTNAGLSFGYTFQGGQQKSDNDKGGTEGADANRAADQAKTNTQEPAPNKKPGDFNYFKIPWSLSFNYNLSYSKPGKAASQIIQVLSFNGDFKLTDKWNFSFNSGYDFKAKEFSYTSFSIKRDLHCWVMSIEVSPFGPYKYYYFRISALSSFLSDLKYDQRKAYYDYSNYRTNF